MTVQQMRNDISNVYDSWKWRNRVEGMPNAQVIAIYKTMQKSGKLNSRDTKIKKQPQYHQMTIFELEKEE